MDAALTRRCSERGLNVCSCRCAPRPSIRSPARSELAVAPPRSRASGHGPAGRQALADRLRLADLFVPEAGRAAHLRVHRDGFRGPDLPYQKAPGTARVALLGDSMIAAVATDAGSVTLARPPEALLNGRRTGTGRFEVQNFGVSSASAGQELVDVSLDRAPLPAGRRRTGLQRGERSRPTTAPVSAQTHRLYFDLDSGGRLVGHRSSPPLAGVGRWPTGTAASTSGRRRPWPGYARAGASRSGCSSPGTRCSAPTRARRRRRPGRSPGRCSGPCERRPALRRRHPRAGAGAGARTDLRRPLADLLGAQAPRRSASSAGIPRDGWA